MARRPIKTTHSKKKHTYHHQARPRLLHVHGISDARVSQGLVAVIAQGLTGADPHAALELEPEGLATVGSLCLVVGVDDSN